MYSIPANPLFPNHPGQPHRRRISTTPAPFSGEIFRRPIFWATTHNPKRRRLIYTPVETPPATGVSRAPTRRSSSSDCHPRAGAWLTFRPRPTHLQARPAASWPSSPPVAPPEPCISTFCSVFGFLAIPTTSDRASSPSPRLGYCFSSSPGTSRPFFLH